jgi:Mitochondrial ribosomal protein subunit L20
MRPALVLRGGRRVSSLSAPQQGRASPSGRSGLRTTALSFSSSSVETAAATVTLRHPEIPDMAGTERARRKERPAKKAQETDKTQLSKTKGHNDDGTPHRKLSADEIQRMRELRTEDPHFWTQRALARAFGVSTLQVGMRVKAPKVARERHSELFSRRATPEEKAKRYETNTFLVFSRFFFAPSPPSLSLSLSTQTTLVIN